jgi:hypothetical protein
MSAPARLDDELEGGFSRRLLGWLIAGAVVSFAAAVVLAAFGRDLDRRPVPFANTYSYSALGHHALTELLRRQGFGVVARRTSSGGIDESHPLVLAEPDGDWLRGKGERRMKALFREAADNDAPLVLVLPKWRGRQGGARRDEWLAAVSLLPEEEVRRALAALGDPTLSTLQLRRRGGAGGLRCTAAWGGSRGTDFAPGLEPAQLLGPVPQLETLVACAGGALMARLVPSKGPEVVLVADPDLLNNQGLARGDDAALILGLLGDELGASGVVFDETVHGFERSPGLLAEALRFPMVLAVLQGLVILGLTLWAGMGRFGKPLPPAVRLAAGKAVLIDNTAALLAQGGDASDSLSRFFRQTVRAVADHYFLAPDLPEPELLARLQRLTQSRGARIDLARVEERIRELPSGGRKGQGRALALARRLYAWRMEMMNGDRKSP